MKAGKLRHRVTIQAKTAITDAAFGGSSDAWEDVVTVWAEVAPLQGRELVTAQSVYAETTTRITMRYTSVLNPSNRIVFEGKYYNLLSVIDTDLKHRELVIMASEGLNEG